MNAYNQVDYAHDQELIAADILRAQLEAQKAISANYFKQHKSMKQTGWDMCDLTDKFGECREFEELLFMAATEQTVDACMPALRALVRAVKREADSEALLDAEARIEARKHEF